MGWCFVQIMRHRDKETALRHFFCTTTSMNRKRGTGWKDDLFQVLKQCFFHFFSWFPLYSTSFSLYNAPHLQSEWFAAICFGSKCKKGLTKGGGGLAKIHDPMTEPCHHLKEHPNRTRHLHYSNRQHFRINYLHEVKALLFKLPQAVVPLVKLLYFLVGPKSKYILW